MKKNILYKILMSVLVVGIFLLPISPSFGLNKSFAQTTNDTKIVIETAGIMSKSASLKVTITNTKNNLNPNTAYSTLYDKVWDYKTIMQKPADVTEVGMVTTPVQTDTATQNFTVSFGSSSAPLIPSHEYFFVADIIITDNNSNIGRIQQEATFSTPADDKTTGDITSTKDASIDSGGLDFKCGVGTGVAGWVGSFIGGGPIGLIGHTINWLTGGSEGTISGCVAGLLYTIFSVVAWLASFAATFLDILVYYSTSSGSYTNDFVRNGWAAIRDVANIFFIVALLYIAIKTILSLNTTNNKKILSTIVIVALLINFSLFFTQVIIDGTNILAKVFYNNINSKYEDKTPTATGQIGQKSISIGLIDKFDPQKIISQETYNANMGTVLFICVTLLLIAMVGYATYIFLTVGLLFVGRVIMLWISMIFAPIAFASYAIPFEIPGIGHKEWWKSLLENAFLAPLFIFMLYIIVMFAGFLNKIVDFKADSSLIQKMMSVFIPFIILMVLLMKAKDIAVKYSGEIGKALQKGGAMITGLALGAATGGMAFAGRATVGRLGNKLAESKFAKDNGRFGRMLGDMGKTAGKSSFDIRRTAAGKGLSKATGMNLESSKALGLGSKEGGYEKYKKEKIEKRQKRAESLKVGENEPLKQKLNEEEMHLQLILNTVAGDFERIDKQIETEQKNKADTAHGSPEEQIVADKIAALKAEKAMIRNTTGSDVTAATQAAARVAALAAANPANKELADSARNHAAAVKVAQMSATVGGRSIKQRETEDIPNAKSNVTTMSRIRTTNYANDAGARGGPANREAQHKIIMESKLDSGTKT
jgi:hypothetical protein